MIINKSNMVVIDLAKKDSPQLNNLFISEDGSTCALNTKCVLVVSPVKDEVRKALPIEETKGERMIIPTDSIKEVLKNMPKDTTFKGLLEHTNVEKYGDGNVNFSLTDGKRRRQIAGKAGSKDFMDFRKLFKRVFRTRTGVRLVVNRKLLIQILSAIDKACPDSSGYSPLFIELTKENDMIFRSDNMTTGQRVVGVLASTIKESGGWIKTTLWEKTFLSSAKKKKKKK